MSASAQFVPSPDLGTVTNLPAPLLSYAAKTISSLESASKSKDSIFDTVSPVSAVLS